MIEKQRKIKEKGREENARGDMSRGEGGAEGGGGGAVSPPPWPASGGLARRVFVYRDSWFFPRGPLVSPCVSPLHTARHNTGSIKCTSVVAAPRKPSPATILRRYCETSIVILLLCCCAVYLTFYEPFVFLLFISLFLFVLIG